MKKGVIERMERVEILMGVGVSRNQREEGIKKGVYIVSETALVCPCFDTVNDRVCLTLVLRHSIMRGCSIRFEFIDCQCWYWFTFLVTQSLIDLGGSLCSESYI
jgi:hypothetical protein